MKIIRGAQPIRPYDPPTSIVRTRSEPCADQDCVVLTAALATGPANIIEHGRWGSYNAILRWRHTDTASLYFLTDVRDTAEPDTA
jgi:hypothetical protein